MSKLDRLGLLRDLFGSIRIPQTVYDEVVIEAPERPGAVEIRQAEWIHVHRTATTAKINYLRADLDRGEAEVLILAEELEADWVLVDESRARVAAELRGLVGGHQCEWAYGTQIFRMNADGEVGGWRLEVEGWRLDQLLIDVPPKNGSRWQEAGEVVVITALWEN